MRPKHKLKERSVNQVVCFDSEMTDEDIATAMDEIGLALFARGKTAKQVGECMTREVKRVAAELEDEQFQYTR
jgi:hypothetical protein